MKKFLITLLAVFSSIAVNAQIGDIGMHYDGMGCQEGHSVPIVRKYKTGVIISYHESQGCGYFNIMFNNSTDIRVVKLDPGHYVCDFEILNNHVYFCGLHTSSSTSATALLGCFKLTSLANPSDQNPSTTIYKTEFSIDGRDFSKLEKMVVYNCQNTTPVVMAVGYGHNCGEFDSPNYCSNTIDFMAIGTPTTTNDAWNQIGVTLFPKERYHDIIETKNHIILVGTIVNATAVNPIGFRKIEKVNPMSAVKDKFYYCQLSEPEPLTYILGEGIDDTDHFVTSTFGMIGGRNGIVVRTFDAANMDMLHAQFIKVEVNNKVRPYDMQYMSETGELIMLQYSVEAPSSRFYYIPPYHGLSVGDIYTSKYEFYIGASGWLYSLDKYNAGMYIAKGCGNGAPILYAKTTLSSDEDCSIRRIADIEILHQESMSVLQRQMNFATLSLSPSLLNYTLDSKNIIIDCN